MFNDADCEVDTSSSRIVTLNKQYIRDWLDNVAEEHPNEFSNNTSTSSDNNGSETTSLDTTGPSDLDMLQLLMVC